jgi:hypothetical protein
MKLSFVPVSDERAKRRHQSAGAGASCAEARLEWKPAGAGLLASEEIYLQPSITILSKSHRPNIRDQYIPEGHAWSRLHMCPREWSLGRRAGSRIVRWRASRYPGAYHGSGPPAQVHVQLGRDLEVVRGPGVPH